MEAKPMNDQASPEELGQALRLLADTIDPLSPCTHPPHSFGELLEARRARALEDNETAGDGNQPIHRKRFGSRRRRTRMA